MMEKTQQSHRLWLWLIPMLLIISALAAAKLNADILFVDEYWSIRNSGGIYGPLDFWGVWERTATVDPGGMGVLYHWLLAAWEAFIGITPFSVRAFSLLAGLLAVSASYQLGKRMFNAQLGLYAALILASSAFFIDYLHEARAYSLLILFTVIAVYAYYRLMYDHKPQAHWYFVLSVSLAALAYTHYVALAMGFVLGIVHLLHFRMTRHWWLMVVAMAIGGLLFLPWFNVTLEVIRRGTEDTGRQFDSMTAFQILQYSLESFSNHNLALFALVAAFSLVNWTKKTAILWLWFGLSLVLVMLINAFIPFMVHLRYLLFVLPALALIIALGIQRTKIAQALLIVWIGAGLYQSLNPAFVNNLFGQIYRAPADGFHQALDILEARAESNDIAIFHIIPPTFEPFNYFPFDYYNLTEPAFSEIGLAHEQFERMNNSFAGGDMAYLEDVNIALQGKLGVWTIRLPELATTQRTGVVNYALATQYLHCETILQSNEIEMNFYHRPSQEEAIGSFGENQLSLYPLREQQTSSEFRLILGYFTDSLPSDTYSIALHLFDEQSNFVGQVDSALKNARPYGCMSLSLDISNLAAGMYEVRARLYAWQTGEILPSNEGDYLMLTELEIP